jgi:hypothetical protein
VVRLGPVVCAAFVGWAHHRRSRAWRVDRRRSSRRDVALARMAAHCDPRSTTSVRFLPPSSHIISPSATFRNAIDLASFSFSGRRLLDAALLRALNSGRMLEVAESPVVGAMLTLLVTDGMATNAGVGP